ARSARARPTRNAAAARSYPPRRLPALRHRCRPRGEGVRRGVMTAGVVAAVGLAVLVVGRARPLRFAALATWADGSAVAAPTLPVSPFVAAGAAASSFADDRRQGAVSLLCYLLPFALLAVVAARLPWAPGWVGTVYAQLAVTALAFAAAGIWQYGTRDVFWGPRTIANGAHETSSWFYRVSPAFDGASAYGRFLVVAILASLVLLLFARGVVPW